MGNSARVGAQIAVDEMNEVGGYLGRPFELVVRDDKATPDLGLKMAEELVLKERVVATIGFCNTGVAAKALDRVPAKQADPDRALRNGHRAHRQVPRSRRASSFARPARDALQTQFLAGELSKRVASRSRLSWWTNPATATPAWLTSQAALAKANIKPAIVVRFAVGVTSLLDEVKHARASGADSLIGWTVGPESGVLAASRSESGWHVPAVRAVGSVAPFGL
jgi:branched-chain amino acid transport system substrate-binding protein